MLPASAGSVLRLARVDARSRQRVRLCCGPRQLSWRIKLLIELRGDDAIVPVHLLLRQSPAVYHFSSEIRYSLRTAQEIIIVTDD